jgi:hypothetical protein
MRGPRFSFPFGYSSDEHFILPGQDHPFKADAQQTGFTFAMCSGTIHHLQHVLHAAVLLNCTSAFASMSLRASDKDMHLWHVNADAYCY